MVVVVGVGVAGVGGVSSLGRGQRGRAEGELGVLTSRGVGCGAHRLLRVRRVVSKELEMVRLLTWRIMEKVVRRGGRCTIVHGTITFTISTTLLVVATVTYARALQETRDTDNRCVIGAV